jgi:hypothetical protein
VSPTPDPWDNPEFKDLAKPQTKEQKAAEKKSYRDNHRLMEILRPDVLN